MTETLTWHPATEPPDADITVLVWVQPGDEWFSGWFDDGRWFDAARGCLIDGVTHWAQPEGPQNYTEAAHSRRVA